MLRVLACVAQNDRQAQRQQQLGKVVIVKRFFKFLQFATLSQYQQPEPVQLRHAKAHQVGVVQNVGAVLVVVAVRDRHANFMQQRRPAKFAPKAFAVAAVVAQHFVE